MQNLWVCFRNLVSCVVDLRTGQNLWLLLTASFSLYLSFYSFSFILCFLSFSPSLILSTISQLKCWRRFLNSFFYNQVLASKYGDIEIVRQNKNVQKYENVFPVRKCWIAYHSKKRSFLLVFSFEINRHKYIVNAMRLDLRCDRITIIEVSGWTRHTNRLITHLYKIISFGKLWMESNMNDSSVMNVAFTWCWYLCGLYKPW